MGSTGPAIGDAVVPRFSGGKPVVQMGEAIDGQI